MTEEKLDLFISYASEDREFVEAIVTAMGHLEVRTWFDVVSLKIGDDLSRSIDKGLVQARFGLVVLSKHFMAKKWTDYELRGLINLEMAPNGSPKILPVWHGVKYEDVVAFSPTLAGRVAIDTSKETSESLTLQILKAVRPDIYNKHPKTELHQIMKGEALAALKAQLQEVREELDMAKHDLEGFQCSTCLAPLVQMVEDNDGGEVYSFECGHGYGDRFDRPCPSDPNFPRFEDFEMVCSEERDSRWICFPKPKTKHAEGVHLPRGTGRSQEEAVGHIKEWYDRAAKPWIGRRNASVVTVVRPSEKSTDKLPGHQSDSNKPSDS